MLSRNLLGHTMYGWGQTADSTVNRFSVCSPVLPSCGRSAPRGMFCCVCGLVWGDAYAVYGRRKRKHCAWLSVEHKSSREGKSVKSVLVVNVHGEARSGTRCCSFRRLPVVCIWSSVCKDRLCACDVECCGYGQGEVVCGRGMAAPS